MKPLFPLAASLLLSCAFSVQAEQAFEYRLPSVDLKQSTMNHLIFQKKKADLERLDRVKPYLEHFEQAVAFEFGRIDEIEKRRGDLFLTADLLAYCIDLDTLVLGYGVYYTQTIQKTYEQNIEFDYLRSSAQQLERCLSGTATRADMQRHVKFDRRYLIKTSFRKHESINQEIRSAQTGFGPLQTQGDRDYWPVFATNQEGAALQSYINMHGSKRRAHYYE